MDEALAGHAPVAGVETIMREDAEITNVATELLVVARSAT
tara:strand:- start:44 stop:163 length:120 start_codon:yes stop_codon:yes gene_type:complete